jgi:flagellar export protein FliJ
MPKYRLEPLLRILEKEKKRKTEFEEEKQNLIDTKKEIRNELDNRVTSEEGVVADSFRYIDYMRGLDEDISQKDRDIERQEEVIEDAKVYVTRARRDYVDAAQEHKVMEKHKELWEKRQQKELVRKEQKEMDELGQVIHQIAQKRKAAKR